MTNPSQSTDRTTPRMRRRGESGQAFLEFFFVALTMMVMLFGLIDFGRYLYEKEVLINLSREGSNLASRGTSLGDTLAAVDADSSLSLSDSNGLVIVSAVQLNNTLNPPVPYIETQVVAGLYPAVSRVGTMIGEAGTASIPAPPSGNPTIPAGTQTLYVTEVFHEFTPITPIGKLIGVTLPAQQYDVAYFIGP